jgi:hypothetical protein
MGKQLGVGLGICGLGIWIVLSVTETVCWSHVEQT